MTPKQTAALYTVKFFASAILTGFAIALLLDLVPLQYIAVGMALAVLAFLIRTTYKIELDRLEILARLNEISKK